METRSQNSSADLPITPNTSKTASSLTVISTQALTGATPWATVVNAFLHAAVDSPHTKRAYGRHLDHAFRSLGVETVADITGAILAGYRAAVTSSPLAPASQAQALAALRTFFRWTASMGAHRLSSETIGIALRSPRADVRRPYVTLSDPEIGDVLTKATTARDRALLATMVGAGLRVAEAVDLDVRDAIEDQDGEMLLSVRRGKGRKSRVVPVRPDVAQLIRTYLAATSRHLGNDGPLFRAHEGAAGLGRRRLSIRAVASIVRRHVIRAGIVAKRVSPHSLRHSFAIRALRTGGSVVAISKLLGHANIATTQRYVDHLALGELRAAVPLLPGASG